MLSYYYSSRCVSWSEYCVPLFSAGGISCSRMSPQNFRDMCELLDFFLIPHQVDEGAVDVIGK
jgi:hypothetical protein